MNPNWKSPHVAAAEARRKQGSEPARKPLSRDYVGDATAAVQNSGRSTDSHATIAAIIIAQALDRLGDRITEAAAIGRRT